MSGALMISYCDQVIFDGNNTFLHNSANGNGGKTKFILAADRFAPTYHYMHRLIMKRESCPMKSSVK